MLICKNGFTTIKSYCIPESRPRFYGHDCNIPCGQCKGDVCDNVTGNCPYGCKQHWSGVRCGGKTVFK